MDSHDALMWREAKGLFLGEKLGEGIARKVYVFRPDPKLVVKIERASCSFQNVLEWEAWNYLCAKHAKWLAPCRHISPCGSILLQDRADPLRVTEKTKRLPKFLIDVKRQNFGMLGDKMVCFDYGTLIHSLNLTSTALIPAKWAGEP